MASSSSSPSGGTDSNHKIGPYTLTKEIGKGSFAVVYQAKYRPAESTKETAAESTPLPSKVAIKIVTRRKLTPKLLENLEGEISILRAVRHVNIVELLDCLKTSTHIYLVMQYCKMGDLSNYIRTRRRATSSSQKADVALANAEANAQYPHPLDGGLNADVTRNFLAQLAAALQFMRGRNIVHRDIKPQNLLLQEPEAELIAAGHHPQIPQVKVADFGFARHLEAASLAETLCGSPLYMAPEILRYEKYDAKADLWSVGAVLYEMCVGKPPFRAVNHVELLRRIEKGEDKVKFPDEKSIDALRKEHERRVEDGKTKDEFVRPHIVDEDLKGLIRQLLKRKPIERMTFENFFNCDVIQSVALPGAKQLQASASSLTDKATPVATRVAPAIPSISRESSLTDVSHRREKEVSTATEAKAATATRSYFKPKYVVGGGGGVGRSTLLQAPRQSKQEGEAPRTPSQEHPSETGEASSLEDNVLETPGSSVTHLPSTARPEVDRSAGATPAAASSGKVSRGQSSLTEDEDKGYVIVEKRTVEVNALADELADAHLAKTSIEPRGPWGALGVVRRPSRLGRIASGLGAAAMAQGVGVTTSTTPPSPGLSTSSSPTSPRQAFSTQRILQASPTSSTSPKLASPPLNAPFAIPLNARRPSFNRRSSQSNDGIVPRLTAPSQSQMSALVPSSAPTIIGSTSGSPLPYSGPSAVPSSALARAISMASIRLFGVPTGMSLRSANVRRSLRMGIGTGGYLSSSPGNAIEYHGMDAAEQNLLNLIHDYGQKSFVLSEFADAKLSLFFSEGPHQGNCDDAGRQGNGSGSSSSVNVVTTGRYGQAPLASYGSLSSEVVAAEALVLYVKSLSFLQRGIDTTKDYIEARTVRYASPFQPGAEINDAVQWLRAKFNDGYERANFARSKACEEMPDSAQHVDKMIFDKALEIARGAALDELGSHRAANEQSWHADKCLLAYETASSMLMALLDPGEEAMELSEASAGTVEKFVKSIHKRMANLQRSQEGVTLAT